MTTTATLDAWASTLPWACNVRDTGCCSPAHNHTPLVGDVCAVPGCDETLVEYEECYYVTQLPRGDDGRERAVCWRHVRPEPVSLR